MRDYYCTVEPAATHGRALSGSGRDSNREGKEGRESAHPSVRNSITAINNATHISSSNSSGIANRALTNTVGSVYSAASAVGGEFVYDSVLGNNNPETDVESALDATEVLTDAEWGSPSVGNGMGGGSGIGSGNTNSFGVLSSSSNYLAGTSGSGVAGVGSSGGSLNIGSALDSGELDVARSSSSALLSTLDKGTPLPTSNAGGWLSGVWGQGNSNIDRARSRSREN